MLQLFKLKDGDIADANLKEHLRELEESHTGLEVRKSREKLDEILADEFFEIGSSGYMFDKKECLETGVVLTVHCITMKFIR
ncbi:DUF4440 domain-containing protein [Actinomycetes bacterium NPDC127524]